MKYATQIVLALGLFLHFASPAYADEDNYNLTAVDSASETGIDSADCQSALILTCDEGGSISSAPAPILGGGAAGLAVIAFGAFVAFRRRQRNI